MRFLFLFILASCSIDQGHVKDLAKAIEKYKQSPEEKEVIKPHGEKGKKEVIATPDTPVIIKDEAVKEPAKVEPVITECVPETIEEPFKNGTLWKPVAEGGGAKFAHNPVFLAKASFKKQFDSCKVILKSGEKHQLTCIDDQSWTHTPYSCFANGDRQHWRFAYSCKKIKSVKIVCKLNCKTIIFKAKGKTCDRHE